MSEWNIEKSRTHSMIELNWYYYLTDLEAPDLRGEVECVIANFKLILFQQLKYIYIYLTSLRLQYSCSVPI